MSSTPPEGIDRAAALRAALSLWHREGKWADVALEGVSMDPIIRDGATLRVRFGRVTTRELRVGDVVIYFSPNRLVAHRVIRVGRRGRRSGLLRVKGDPVTSRRATWVKAEDVLGRVTAVTQPDGSRRYLNTPAGRLLSRSAAWVSMTIGAVDARLPRRQTGAPVRTMTRRCLGILTATHDTVHRYLETERGRLMGPEERFIVASCRPSLPSEEDESLRALAAEVRDWEQVREQVVSLGLAPILYGNLTASGLVSLVPDEVLARLARAGHASTYVGVRQREELGRILDCLAAEGIDPILLKGAALCATVYDDPAMRTMSDLDLLLDESTIETASAAIVRMGYQQIYRPIHADPEKRAAFYRRHRHSTPLLSPGGHAIVELHRHIMGTGEITPEYKLDSFRDRSHRVHFNGRSLRVPAPADLVLHTCLHMSYADRFVGKLRDLIDLDQTIRTAGREIDWNRFLQEVPSAGAARGLYSCLDLARRLYETPVPEDLLYELRRTSRLGIVGSRLLRALAFSVLFRSARSQTGILTTASAHWCCDTLLHRTGWPSRLKALALLLADG